MRTVTLDHASHTYRDELGRQYMSVTTLLGADDHFDAEAVAQQVTENPRSVYYGQTVEEVIAFWEASAMAGTQLHAAVEEWIKTRALPAEDSPNFYQVKAFSEGNWRGALQSEIIVYDEDLMLAGTLDIRERFAGYSKIHDVKTCRSIDDDKLLKYSMQLDIYRRMATKLWNEPVHVGVIVWFPNFVQDLRSRPRSERLVTCTEQVDELLARRRKELSTV